MGRTCHHFVPPATHLMASSPPNTLMRYAAAASQEDNGTRARTTFSQGGDNDRVLVKLWNSSTVCLYSMSTAVPNLPRRDVHRRILHELLRIIPVIRSKANMNKSNDQQSVLPTLMMWKTSSYNNSSSRSGTRELLASLTTLP